jgi:hypothetical protein
MTLNGVTDEQYIKLIQIKDESNGKLAFNINNSIGTVANAPTGAGKTVINGINLSFPDSAGAKFAAKLLDMLGS